jgi:hypothetical protein
LQHLPERLRHALTQNAGQIARFIAHPPPEFDREIFSSAKFSTTTLTRLKNNKAMSLA